MLKTGASQLHRVLTFVLALVLLMTTWTLPAKAQNSWDELFISISATDMNGMPVSIPATPVAGSEQPAYWVTLDPFMLGSMLTVEVTHPDPGYRFYFNTNDLYLFWDTPMDALSLDTLYANYLGYDYNGEFRNDFILLYVSTQPVPADLPTDAPADVSVQVPVRYVLEDGRELDMHYVTGQRGQVFDVRPTSAAVGDYLIVGDSVQSVYVDEFGVSSPETVVFTYRVPVQEPEEPEVPAPQPVLVTVHYYDTLGSEIARPQTGEYLPGTYTFTAPAIDGYELMMEDVLTVTVYEDGVTAPSEIGFYYRPQPKYADVPVTYTDRDGRIIAETFVLRLEPSRNHTIAADPQLVPDGYDAASAEAVDVYVSQDGVASPERVYLAFDKEVVETPIPVGETVNRYADLNKNSVAFRSEPTTAGRNETVIKRLGRGDTVYLVREQYNDAGERWAEIIVNGRVGYMMSEYLNVMTQAESDRYAASVGATPVPTYTPEPTFMPVPTFTPEPTATPDDSIAVLITPTATATATPSATPTATPTAAPYTGYALTNRTTALRTGINASDVSIIRNMEANQLVNVSGQLYDGATGQAWSIVTTLNGNSGYVLDADLRYISYDEAGYYIDAWLQQQPTDLPTELPTNTPAPVPVEGYAITIFDQAPLRTMTSQYSSITAQLPWGTVVYVTGQTMADGAGWYSVQYSGVNGGWGYIRSDLVRMMTDEETANYLSEMYPTPTPTSVTTNIPFDEQGMSSYGYVDSGSVNFREGPSMDARRIRELKRYALGLVLGSEKVGGATWYKIRYGNDEGYIHGDYFHQLRISELNGFLNSEEYRQGVKNNSSSGSNANDDVGFTGPGGLVSEEDQTISQWQDPNSGVHVSYAPFDPIETVRPIQNTSIPTLEPLPGWAATATLAPTVTPTPTMPALPDVTYPSASGTGGAGSALLWIVVVVLLLIAAAGVFAFVRYQQHRRRIALRAAQRRAQAARSAEQRNYAARPVSGQPRTGMYPEQNVPQVRRPVSQNSFARPQAGAPYTPYARREENVPSDTKTYPTVQSGDTKPVAPVNDAARSGGRVGRRTAYRQAQENQKNDLDV